MIGAQLQKAIYEALTASPAIAGGRVYDNPPASPTFPYLTIGDEQVLDAGNSCAEGWEAFPDIHVWSRPATRSKAEMKTIAAAVGDRLLALDAVDDFRVVIGAIESVRPVNDPDGITEHCVVTMRYVLDPA